MRERVLAVCAVVLVAGCGVNPDRLATMHEKNASVSESRTSASSDTAEEDAPPLEYDDRDPAVVRDAIMSLRDLEALVKEAKYYQYLQDRYDLMRSVSYEATEPMATSAKAPLIIDRVYDLDQRVAKAAGGRAEQAFSTVGRADVASADALYALDDAFRACRTAAEAQEKQARDEAWTKYESSVQRAQAVDERALTYVGKKINGTGWIDVPVELAVCEARVKTVRAQEADSPPVAENKAKSYEGCGFYPIDLEAKQQGSGFGEYLITSVYVADQDPGFARPAECSAIPPASDAEPAVQSVIREFVAWLQPEDVVSMAGPFRYEGPEGEKLKIGTARVYRRNARLQSNACGANDPNVTCEAEGSPLAKAYNHVAHYLGRADYHRGHQNAARCKKMADFAFKAANVTSPEGADKKFLVSNGRTLTRKEITDRLEEMKQKARTAMSGDWCATP